ncbi:MAG TPA: efflux RND transporter periplasmic adaptor subunit [Ignavibacteriaceae bacterium]|nr:efflux RND transporter periplasmic adaptor subunit [Ignavibacteriaceae bacterium]
MNKRIKSIIIGLTILIVLLLIFLPKLLSSGDSGQAMQNPGRMNLEVPVTAHIVSYEKLSNNVFTTGSILANEEVELRSETSGKIVEILFREGAYVSKGDLLVKINDADLQAELRKAESKVKLVEDREARQKQLAENQMISQEDYESTLNDLEASKAEYDLIKAQIDKTEIRAPFSGVIGLREVSEGSFVTTSNIIARLQSLSNLKIDFAIPQKYASQVKIGDELSFKLSGSDFQYKAKIFAIEPKIDPSTRTLKLRAICTATYKGLFPGAFANVELNLKETEEAILITTVAIVPELKGQLVYLYRGGVATPQKVELGLREEKRVQITSGLAEGDTVINSGILQIRPGAKVKITEFN